MVGIKDYTFGICIAGMVVSSMSFIIDPKKGLPVTDQWLENLGCPGVGYIVKQCETCVCNKIKEAPECTGCPAEVKSIENWKHGIKCPAGEQFYSGCSDCKCNASGKDATCNHRGCKFYYSAEKKNRSLKKENTEYLDKPNKNFNAIQY